ncbi:leukocyte elastase inhibitor B-like [Oppia nitens]|uniref:leukocyte elastase inhibitor B-like n=1 Tax=Oppia nitens TaxID=1686743 RepID=UPI0023D9EFF1|nr:leukocyte elastase inhibitor B-like [Oppia nitens]
MDFKLLMDCMKTKLNVANLVVRDESELILKQEFVDAIQLAFRAQVDRADFKHNAVAETDKINQWIRKQTNNKIQEIFKKLDAMTSLIILNTIYFKGDWEEKLNGLSTLKTRINAINFDKAFKSMDREYVNLFLPKFKSEKEYDLMKDINPKPIALTTGADLSRLSTSCDKTVSQIKHKTFISIDEYGTEAAAVTAVVMKGRSGRIIISQPIEFRVDHPFLYYIIDKTNGMIMFSGQINKL